MYSPELEIRSRSTNTSMLIERCIPIKNGREASAGGEDRIWSFVCIGIVNKMLMPTRLGSNVEY
jgi:hypothetical protein